MVFQKCVYVLLYNELYIKTIFLGAADDVMVKKRD